MDEHKKTGMGRFISYNQLPDIVWEQILPEFFGINPIGDGMVENMKQVLAGVCSKGRNLTRPIKSGKRILPKSTTRPHPR